MPAKTNLRSRLLLLAFVCAPAIAAEKTMLHCFTFTPSTTASAADWTAFRQATLRLPAEIRAVRKIWIGKLAKPLPQLLPEGDVSEAARDALLAGRPAGIQVRLAQRTEGVCMLMNGAEALQAYAAHPYHKTWDALYSKVREPGSTTFDVLGQ